MKNNRCLNWLAAILVTTAMCVVGRGYSQQLTYEEVSSYLDALKSHQFTNEVSSTEISTLKRTASGFSQPTDSWAAILQLWIAGERDFVELLWWQKDDPETRAFIVSLEWCMVALPSKNSEFWPGGIRNYEQMSKRFESTERAMRAREVDFVRQNREVLARKLSAILAANRLKIAERYKAVAEQASTGRGE
jgi:hypothetical protein